MMKPFIEALVTGKETNPTLCVCPRTRLGTVVLYAPLLHTTNSERYLISVPRLGTVVPASRLADRAAPVYDFRPWAGHDVPARRQTSPMSRRP